jgi:hypothetical protein
VKRPQTKGICERFHKTVLNEFYRVAFRKKFYATLAEIQQDLDTWMSEYNTLRPHQGRWCYGKTPMQTWFDAVPLATEKQIAERASTPASPAKSARAARASCSNPVDSGDCQIKLG